MEASRIAGCAVALVAGVLARLNGQVKSSSARERRASARVSPSGRPSTPVERARDAPPRRRRSSASSRGRLRLARTGARGGCAPRRGGHASHASNWRQGSSAAPIGIADSYPTDRDRSKGILPIRDLKPGDVRPAAQRAAIVCTKSPIPRELSVVALRNADIEPPTNIRWRPPVTTGRGTPARPAPMQEGSMKFVVAAVGSDSEETAALLELLAGERLGFDRPQGEVDEDRPRFFDTRPTRRGDTSHASSRPTRTLSPRSRRSARRASCCGCIARASSTSSFSCDLGRLREARDALADAALDPPVLVVVGVARKVERACDPTERDGTDDEVREQLAPTPPFRATEPLPPMTRHVPAAPAGRGRCARCCATAARDAPRVRRRLRRRRVQNRCNAIDRRAEKDRRCR